MDVKKYAVYGLALFGALALAALILAKLRGVSTGAAAAE